MRLIRERQDERLGWLEHEPESDAVDRCASEAGFLSGAEVKNNRF